MSSLDGAIDIATALLHSLETYRHTEQELQRQVSEGLEREARLQTELTTSHEQLGLLESHIRDVHTQRDSLAKRVELQRLTVSSEETISLETYLRFIKPEALHGFAQVSRNMASITHDESLWAEVLNYPVTVCDPHNFKATFVAKQAADRIQSLCEVIHRQETHAIFAQLRHGEEMQAVQSKFDNIADAMAENRILTWTIAASRLHQKYVTSPYILPGVYLDFYPQGNEKGANHAALFVTMPNQGDELDVRIWVDGKSVGTIQGYWGKKTKNSDWGLPEAGPKKRPSKRACDVKVMLVFSKLRYEQLNFNVGGGMTSP